MENKFSIFDVVGPAMVGPSSSHTAGAAKIAYIARSIYAQEPKKVIFYLHGSFAETYKGHGTDRALVGGILLLAPDSERIKSSFEIAKQKDIEFEFVKRDLGDVHPNTVMIEFINDQRTKTIIGCSIGGGKVMITKINTTDVELSCEYATLITKHDDKPGAIAKISTILSEYNINIAFMKVFRNVRGKKARLIVEIDGFFDKQVIDEIRALDIIDTAEFIESLKI